MSLTRARRMFLTVLFSFNFYCSLSLRGSQELESHFEQTFPLFFTSLDSFRITVSHKRYLKYNILLQDPFFKNSWDDFDRLRQDMVKESKEFWNKAEAIQMEKPKAEEGAAPPPPTPMFFPVRLSV